MTNGFTDHYTHNEKPYFLFAPPYIPSKDDERFTFMHTTKEKQEEQEDDGSKGN